MSEENITSSTPYTADSKGRYTTSKERITSYLSAFGGSAAATLVGLFSTFMTDINISATLAASLLFIVRIWDAINDPLAAGIIEKTKFKSGKYIPWLKFSTVLLPILLIFKFATQDSWPLWVKIICILVTYILYEGVFTFYDVPVFGMHLVRTNNVQERTSLASIAGVFSAIGMLLATILIPILQGTLGWLLTAVIFAVIQLLTTVWYPRVTKERFKAPTKDKVSIKDLINGVVSNKYLLIYYISLFVSFGTATFQTVAMYFARWNLGDQNMMVPVVLALFLPALLFGVFLPILTKRFDKFKVFYSCLVISSILCVIQFFVGYGNLLVFLIIFGIRGVFFGGISLLAYQFTSDMVIYQRYKTGENTEAISFSFQTFTAKMISAVTGSLALFIMGICGFISGENVSYQPSSAISAIWWCFTLIPAFGAALGLIGFSFYKLRDHDVQLMALVNNKELTKEEAEQQFIKRF